MAAVHVLDEAYRDSTIQLTKEFPNIALSCGEINNPDRVTALISDSSSITSDTLNTFPNLKAIVKMGRNSANVEIDMSTLEHKGITLIKVPRKGPNCVAELAITLILALSKDLLMSHQSVAEGAYRYRGLKPELSSQTKMAFHWMKHASLHEVRGKTLGIIGMGEIGCEAALRANALGMNINYYKRTPLPKHLEEGFNATYQPFDSLLSGSDYVLVAVPHTSETENMIDTQQLALMKPSSYLINICRGGVINEQALISSLKNQEIAGAGLDVFQYEPLPFDSPLCHLHNVILTPHVGGGSGTNRQLELSETISQTVKVLGL